MRLLCAIAGVSRGGYYKYLTRPKSVKQQQDEVIVGVITAIQKRLHRSVGYRKMVPLLKKEAGLEVGSTRARRLMRENDLKSAVRIKKHSDEVYIRRRKAREALPPDLIQRNFFATAPYKRLVTDIAVLPCLEGKMYLNSIADLYNGEILAHHKSLYIDTKLCIDTLEKLGKAIDIRGAIIHSDGGPAYMSYAYRAKAEELGLTMSLGTTGDCYDNAAMESLNGIIKTECLYCRFGKTNVLNRRVPRNEIISAIDEFIPYYNNERPKERLGFLSPVEFRLQNPAGTAPAPQGLTTNLLLSDDWLTDDCVKH